MLPAAGDGIHHIVAGHRRHAASVEAGRTTVPCIVRAFIDEAEIVLAMLAENSQRSDGLNVVDEAQALAAVIDLRGGTVSVRKLAAATAHCEGWVRTRLALLTLPDAALDALHAGLITLDVANTLTALAEWPELIETLVSTGKALTVWQVEAAHRSQLVRLAVAQARERIESTGVVVVTEDDWQVNVRSWKTLDDAHLDVDAHREPCHAIVVKARFDASVVKIPICTEPRRHTGRRPDSELVAPPVPLDETAAAESAERRERRHATEARTLWLTDRLKGRGLPTGEVFGLAMLTWIETAPNASLQRAAALLGLETPDGTYVDHARLIIGDVGGDTKRLTAVALTVAAVIAEDRGRQSLRSPTVARYLDTIERLGYQPTDWEHTQRLTTDPADSAIAA